MTENIETDETEYDFDAWLEGASPTTTSVTILQNPSLLGDYEDWQRRYKLAEKMTGELAAGEKNPLTTLEAEGEELLARINQSRSTWHLRALTYEQTQAIVAAFPDPKMPQPSEAPPTAPTSPTDAQARAFVAAWEAWKVRHERWEDAHRDEFAAVSADAVEVLEMRGAEKIARSVVRIEQGGRTVAKGLTTEQARHLPDRIGDAQVGVILRAIDRASNDVPEVPIVPLSHGSGSDPE